MARIEREIEMKLKYLISIVNVGGIDGYQVWKGSAYCKQTLASGFKTKGEAWGWAIDNGYCEEEGEVE
jgi:hypothetical protein